MTDSKRRLHRLQDDLEELIDSSTRPPFSFSCITSDLVEPLHSQSAWDYVQQHVAKTRSGDPIILEFDPIWQETCPDGKSAIRWWGNPQDVERFKEWAERLGHVLNRHDDLLPGIDIESGVAGGLKALCATALSSEESSSIVVQRMILDAATTPKLPPSLSRCMPPPRFYVQEVRCFAHHLARRSLSILLGQRSSEPRLKVEVDQKRVTVDGISYQPDDVIVAILDILAKANGIPVSQSTMQAQNSVLEMEERFDRLIKRFKTSYPDLGNLIESSTKGYWVPEEYLT